MLYLRGGKEDNNKPKSDSPVLTNQTTGVF